jgi:hypothetical protein
MRFLICVLQRMAAGTSRSAARILLVPIGANKINARMARIEADMMYNLFLSLDIAILHSFKR